MYLLINSINQMQEILDIGSTDSDLDIFIDLITCNDSIQLDYFLQTHEIDSRYVDGFILACKKGFENIVQLLLTDARIDASEYYNQAIYSALESNCTEIILLLLKDPRSDELLYWNQILIKACHHGIIDIVRLCLAKGIELSLYDHYAIYTASINGHSNIVELLLEDENIDYKEIFFSMCRRGYLEIVKNLIHGNKIDLYSQHHYYIAILGENCYMATLGERGINISSEKGHDNIVKLLLDYGIDPRTNNNHAIRWASRNGYPKVVALLLADSRADPSAQDNYAIRMACQYNPNDGQYQTIKLLLADPRVDSSAQNNYAINYCAKFKSYDVCELLFLHDKMDKYRGGKACINAFYHIRDKKQKQIMLYICVLEKLGLVKDVIDIIVHILFDINNLLCYFI